MLNVENKVLWLIDGVRFRYCAETLIKTNSDSNFDSPRPIIPRTLQSPYNAHLGSQALTHDVTAASTFRHSSLPIYITSLQSFGFRRYFRHRLYIHNNFSGMSLSLENLGAPDKKTKLMNSMDRKAFQERGLRPGVCTRV